MKSIKRSTIAAFLILAMVLSVSLIDASDQQKQKIIDARDQQKQKIIDARDQQKQKVIDASDQQKQKPTGPIRADAPSGENLSKTENSDVVPSEIDIQDRAPFSVNACRFDPYKNFKFRVKWDGRYVAFVSNISPLIRTTEVIEYRDGGDPSSSRKSPGLTRYDPIILERGVSHDPDFEAWVSKVWSYGHGLGAEVSLQDFRKDIRIEFFNEAGQLALAYNVYRCWPSEYQALPELDAKNSGVAFQRIKLENEGWLRDEEVTEPNEPVIT